VSKKTAIVCIDDEHTIVDSLEIQLNKVLRDEYAIETAEGAEDALELIDELLNDGYEIAIVISDYIMPGMNGDELLRKIHEISPDTIKIMLTGQADLDAVSNAVKYANLYRFLTKPWENQDLILTVKEAGVRYANKKKFEEQTLQLQTINQDLAKLNHKQTELIEELHTNQQHLKNLNEQLSHLNKACSRFVPRAFLNLLQKDSIADIQLGDQIQKDMSILLSDIRGFTSFSEAMKPEDNFKFINAYLSRMEPSIIQNNGFIDKYIGDAIMALFNQGADSALRAGLDMLKALTEYNQTRSKPDRPNIKIGIGINTGTLMLGTVGGQSRMDGTVISSAVSLAYHLESLTKSYGVSLLISEATYASLQDPSQYDIRAIDRIQAKGRSELVLIYEVFDADPPELNAGKKSTEAVFDRGFLLYHQQDFEEALKFFEICLDLNPEDSVAQLYLDRCREGNPAVETALA
jgi:class 3 adenylate cyclase/FixJ family two-component response regulator